MSRSLTFPLGKHGRLGNSLFQLAGTVGTARLLGRSVQFDPDWPYRTVFNLPDEWFGTGPAEDVRRHLTGSPWRVKYMQDPAIWWHVRDEIRDVLAPSQRASAVLDSLPCVDVDDIAVHVRRTDYASFPDHLPMLDADYYRAAVRRVTAQLGRDWNVHVYGDDPVWVEYELPEEWTFCRRGWTDNPDTDWCDLLRMSRYNRIVTANSSYSWFAAFLAEPLTQVCAPVRWFGPKIPMQSPALNSWMEAP